MGSMQLRRLGDIVAVCRCVRGLTLRDSMAPRSCLNDVFFKNLGFLKDSDVLTLTSTAADIRSGVIASRCSALPIELLPGDDIYGLWNHLDLKEIRRHTQLWGKVVIPYPGMRIYNADIARAFPTAFDLAMVTYLNLPPEMTFVATFKFQDVVLSKNAEFQFESSKVQVPEIDVSLVLVLTKERLPNKGEYGINFFLWRKGTNRVEYAFAVVPLVSKTKLLTNFTIPVDVTPEEDKGFVECHQWLYDRDSTLIQDIEDGREMICIISAYDLSVLEVW